MGSYNPDPTLKAYWEGFPGIMNVRANDKNITPAIIDIFANILQIVNLIK